MMRMSVKLPDLSRINYSQEVGVVIGDSFLTKERFKSWFNELLNAYNTTEYIEFARSLKAAVNNSTKNEDGRFNFTEKLASLQAQFLKFTTKTSIQGMLGGDISVLTTFNFGEGDQQSYFITSSDAMPSVIRNKTGGTLIQNSIEKLKALQEKDDRIKKINDSFQRHLENFYNELQEDNADKEDRKKLYIWAYYNMKERYLANKKQGPMSLAKYFWGDGQIHGYVSEAYGAHVALAHADILTGEHMAELQKSVISEHGGKGSRGLFALLNATKGHTSSQLSGDIVIVNPDGKVTFNIQSKASTNASYYIYTTYQEFLNNAYKFLSIYEGWSENKRKEQDLDYLFKIFSTTAWVPIQKKLQDNVQKEISAKLK